MNFTRIERVGCLVMGAAVVLVYGLIVLAGEMAVRRAAQNWPPYVVRTVK